MRFAKGGSFIFVVTLLLALGSPALATVTTVTIGDFFFSQDTITVNVGDTVRWTNTGIHTHTTTSNTGVWDSGLMANGVTFEFQFNSAGSFPYICTLHPTLMKGLIISTDLTGVRDEGGFPSTFSLRQNYPNPFNPTTSIRYGLSEDSHVTLTIYNMLGQPIATLVNEQQSAGYREVVWNGTNDAGETIVSGIYIYRLATGKYTATRRMVLLK